FAGGARGTYLGCMQPGTDNVVDLQGPEDRQDLPDFDETTVSSQPQSVASEDGRTDWRVMTARLPDGYTVLVATDLERDQAAIRRLVALEAVVCLILVPIRGAARYAL